MLNFKGIFFTTPLFLRGQKSPCLAKVEKETISVSPLVMQIGSLKQSVTLLLADSDLH